MKLTTILKLIRNGQFAILFKILKMSNEFYRVSFISSACSQGIYDQFVNGKASFEELCGKIGVSVNKE